MDLVNSNFKICSGAEKKLVSSPTNKALYEIMQMSAADVGKYMCIAVNDAGRKTESMSLVIDDGKACKDNEFRYVHFKLIKLNFQAKFYFQILLVFIYRCKSGDQCIPRDDRCDNERDCRDGSDEENCKGNRRSRRNAKF